ncbi:MAG TPA: phosphatidate cytidylyltransferase [Thermoleophilaceae bacterium]|nr:phosphatidate cytidylyltransferase [Thermoleophilaceae bacterium]
MPETARRVVQALPLIVFAGLIVGYGGPVFMVGVLALGILALNELYRMMGRARPVNLAGFLTLVALCLVALYGDRQDVVLVLVIAFPVTYFLAVMRPRRENVSWGIAVTFLGVLWIGLALVHAILLREMDHGGALVLLTLVGTFISDTAAYFAGRRYGRTQITPRISPNKTLEGLVAGIAGGTFMFWLVGLGYHHEWFNGTDRLLIGLAVACAAPLGDLFESLLKRDLGVKDAGRTFGSHGGVLDRLDGALFALPAAYYVSLAVL